MAIIAYPKTLTKADWNTKRGVLGKTSKKTGVSEALVELDKIHGDLKFDDLVVGNADTLAKVNTRLVWLEKTSVKDNPFQAAIAKAKEVKKLADETEVIFKKSLTTPKSATEAAKGVAAAAKKYADDITDALSEGVKDLKKELPRLQQEADDLEEKNLPALAVKKNVIKAFKVIKAGKGLPGATQQFFLLAVGKASCCPFLAPAAPPPTRKELLRAVMAGETALKFYSGECIWERDCYTFVGADIPTGGLVKKLQAGLLELTGQRYKLRVRRLDGESEEAEGDIEAQDPNAPVVITNDDN